MNSLDWVRHMVRYNRWQNANLIGAADSLDAAARILDRGAFFGSILRTFSHLLWADTIWIARLDGRDSTDVDIDDSPDFVTDWQAFKKQRASMDQRIADWADSLDNDALQGVLEWRSVMTGKLMSLPMGICVTQLFNHQTHHRGQIHAMLTAAGATPGGTDLPFMPEDA